MRAVSHSVGASTENADLKRERRLTACLGRPSVRAPTTPIFGASAANTSAIYTSGGLVMTVVAQGATLAGTRGRALINTERVLFEGRTFRSDIAAREFG